MNERLAKLDILGAINEKMNNFEKNMAFMKTEIDNIKSVQQKHSHILHNEEKHHHNIEDRVQRLEENNIILERENFEVKEKLLELKTHSMKYNLIFAGIPNTEGVNENTETVLRDFLNSDLGITDANTIPLQNVHRLGERPDGGHRSIIARFTRFNDHEKVRKAAAEKLRDKPNFSVYQQFPQEIYERRKRLIPKLKEFQRKKRKVKLVYDKLYVDGHLYDPRQAPHIPGLPERENTGH